MESPSAARTGPHCHHFQNRLAGHYRGAGIGVAADHDAIDRGDQAQAVELALLPAAFGLQARDDA